MEWSELPPPGDRPIEELICRNPRTIYFVDFDEPSGRVKPPPAEFRYALGEKMSAAATGGGGGWFEPAPPPGAEIRAIVDPLLQDPGVSLPMPQYKWRADAKLRFFRIHFTAAGQTLAVRANAHCAVVDRLRKEAQALAGADAAPKLRVGGEWCAVSVQNAAWAAASVADPGGQQWHLRAIGAPSGKPVNAFWPLVTLLDGGVNAVVSGGVDKDSLEYYPNRSWTRGQSAGPKSMTRSVHPHGAAMLVLMQSFGLWMPNAQASGLRETDVSIKSQAVLEASGSGAITHLAAGLDNFLSPSAEGSIGRHRQCGGSACFPESSNAGLRLANMSLGWPAEIERSETITGPECSTMEDPLGASIRYLLHAARAMDSTEFPVLAVVAAGNRPPRPAAAQRPEVKGFAYPAAYGLPDCACGDDAGCRDKLGGFALPVGPIDELGRPSSFAIQPEPSLVAPGEHVPIGKVQMLDDTDQPLIDTFPFVWPLAAGLYASSSTSSAVAFEYPSIWSGSSVAAALVTASIARAYQEQICPGGSRDAPCVRGPGADITLSGRAWARLAYLTGTPLDGRKSVDGVQVHAICAGKLIAAAAKLNRALAGALELRVGGAYVNPKYLSGSKDVYQEFAKQYLKDTDCPLFTPANKLQRPENYNPETGLPEANRKTWTCREGDGGCWSSCGPNEACGYDPGTRPDRYSIAMMGPQPAISTCPPCSVLIGSSVSLDFDVSLSSGWGEGVTLENQTIVIKERQTGAAHYLKLDPTLYQDWANLWVSGNHFILKSIKGPPDLNLMSADLDYLFVTEVHQPGHATIIDYNPLYRYQQQ